jgi:hypothetical protein
MATKTYVRKRIFVDPRLQGALVVRIVAYWLLCLAAMAVMLRCFQAVAGVGGVSAGPADDLRLFCSAAAVGTLLFLPLVAVDVVRLSHRFVGPMVRLRRTLRELGCGQRVEPIRFRDGDFWQEVAAEFNAVIERVQGPSSRSDLKFPSTLHEVEVMQTAGAGSCGAE